MEGWQKLVGSRLKGHSAGPHPNPDVLAAFAEKALAGSEQESVLRHLAGCSDCRDVLYLSMPETRPLSTAVSMRGGFGVVMRWGAVAASMAIVGVALSSHYFSQNTSAPTGSQVAEVKSPAGMTELDAIVETRAQAANAQGAKKKTREDVAREVAKIQPPAKAMTGTPAGKMEFDQSGQVHIAAAPVPEQELKSKKDLRVTNEVTLADSQRTEMKESDLGLSKSIAVGGTAGIATEQGYDRDKLDRKQSALPAAPVSSLTYTTANARAMRTIPARWTVSAEGAIERSFDSGKTWVLVPVAEGVVFRAVATFGTNVWAGGSAGALYRSQDSGSLWVRLEPAVAGQKLEGDITRIDFRDALHGVVNTASGETWNTSDGGATWSRK